MPKINIYQQQTSSPTSFQQPTASAVPQSQTLNNALQSAGQNISNAAMSGASLYAQDLQNENALWVGNAVASAQLDWTEQLLKRQREAKGPAYGFTQTLREDFNKYAQEVIKTAPNERAAKALQAEFKGLEVHLGKGALQFENNAYIEYQDNQLETIGEKQRNLVIQDPARAPTIESQYKRMLDEMPIPQDQKNKIFRVQHEKMQRAFFDSMLQNQPEVLNDMLEPVFGVGKLPKGSPAKVIEQAAKKHGVNPLAVLVAGKIESKLNPKQGKTNIPESTATGTFQFIESTAADYGLTKESSFEEQAEAAAKFTKDNIKHLKSSLHKEPTINEIYLAHHFGRQGAVDILKADRNEPITSVISEKTAKQNNLLGKTVGEVLAENDTAVKQASREFSSQNKLDEKYKTEYEYIINSASPENILYYKNASQQAVKQKQEKLKIEYKQLATDQIAEAYDGIIPENQLTHDQFLSVYDNKEQGEREWNKYASAMKLGYDMHQMLGMPAAERNKMIQNYQNIDPNAPGYADAQKRRDELIQANQVIGRQIQKDAAGFLTKNNPVVRKAFMDMQNEIDPAKKEMANANYYSALTAAEQAEGIQFPRLLSVEEENADVEFMKNSEGQNLAQLVTQVSQKYGKFWPQIYQQLASNDHFPNAALVIASLPNNDLNTKVEIGNVANLKIDELKGNINKDIAKTITDSAQKQTSDFVDSLPTGLSNQKTINAFQDTWTKLALSYARTASQKDAMQMATKALFKNYSFKDNKALPGMKMRIPNNNVQFTPEEIYNGIDASKNIDAKDLRLPIDLTGVRKTDRLVEEFGAILSNNSIWETNEDETGLYLNMLAYNGRPLAVYNKDGSRYKLTWDQLKKLSGSGNRVYNIQHKNIDKSKFHLEPWYKNDSILSK